MLGEKEIYSLLIQNPERGLEKIMDEYMAFVYTIVNGKLSCTSNKQDVEECVSDIFYEVYRTRNLIDLEKGSLKSYLAVLSKRRSIDVFRKLRNNAHVSLDKFEHDWIASDIDIEKGVVDRETNDLLIQEIKALGEPDSQIIIRKYYFGQTSKIISKALGIKENTVNKKVSRALVKLKQALGGAL
ncbi:MAG: sigma-70 family RNA polymerase sigma factor [Oscillospiraceae bacterium]|nr:sigma-70 family RNA polymerase sigma factor [Oscillospiraceae bacterium]